MDKVKKVFSINEYDEHLKQYNYSYLLEESKKKYLRELKLEKYEDNWAVSEELFSSFKDFGLIPKCAEPEFMSDSTIVYSLKWQRSYSNMGGTTYYVTIREVDIRDLYLVERVLKGRILFPVSENMIEASLDALQKLNEAGLYVDSDLVYRRYSKYSLGLDVCYTKFMYLGVDFIKFFAFDNKVVGSYRAMVTVPVIDTTVPYDVQMHTWYKLMSDEYAGIVKMEYEFQPRFKETFCRSEESFSALEKEYEECFKVTM